MRYCSCVLWVVASFCFVSNIMAAEEVQKEDLTACKLPHGELLIPDRNAPEAKSGYILRISDGTLNPSPLKAGERPKSAADFLLRITNDKAGDLMYSSLNEGSFVAVSTRATDLGKKFLYEVSGLALDRPQPVQSKEERSGSGEATPGVIDGVQDGHCYLVETANGKFALVRIIERRGRSALIQYVYQPDGTRTFNIPEGKITGTSPAASATGENVKDEVSNVDSVNKLGVHEFEKAVVVFKEHRAMLSRMSIQLVASANTATVRRRAACDLLGEMRSPEASATLAAMIDVGLVLESSEVNFGDYGCVLGLIKIGIPGANAALGQIETDAKSELTKQVNLREFNNHIELRRNLFALVTLKVYGERLAKVVLEDKIAQTADPKVKEAYQKALEAFPRVKNWLPEEDAATTMPAAVMPTK